MRGTGGPNGVRVYWPAGLEAMTLHERAAALAQGWWYDGDAIVTRDGRRIEKPTESQIAELKAAAA